MFLRLKIGLLYATALSTVLYLNSMWHSVVFGGGRGRLSSSNKCNVSVYEERRKILEDVCQTHSEELEDQVRQVSK